MVNAANMAETLESELEIRAFIKKETTTMDIQVVRTKIENMPGIASVVFVSKEQALDEFRRTYGGSHNSILEDLGGNNPLDDELRIKARNARDVVALAETIDKYPEVDKVRYGKGYVEKILTLTKWLRWIGFGVVVAFGIAAIVLISINVKINVFSRRREIQIMRLVGASNSFIRWPFLIEGMTLGFVGGLLAAVAVGASYNWLVIKVQSSMIFFPIVQDPELFTRVLSGLVLLGLVMGAFGSVVSLQRFLRY